MKAGIFYGGTTGNTENAARLVGELLSGSQVISVDDAGRSDFDNYDVLILGASPWRHPRFSLTQRQAMERHLSRNY